MELKLHDQEILLQKLWKSRKLFQLDLQTTAGANVEVIFAGRENLDSGPDFRDAVVKVGGKLLQGDVEVHLRESGWYDHGHHTDPKYNNVILHLIAEPADQGATIEREDGVRVPQVCIPEEQLRATLWKKSAPSPRRSADLVVADCPLSRSDSAAIARTVWAAGQQRFQLKVEQLREDRLACSWDQLLYKRILESLGYAKNQGAFRKLAERVPYETITTEMRWVEPELAEKKCAALLFGGAGFLPQQQRRGRTEPLDAATLDYVAPLEYLWRERSHSLGIRAMSPREWQFFRLRPQNFPTRRIAGMVVLLTRAYQEGFLQRILRVVRTELHHVERAITELEALFVVPAEGYWTTHYRFDEAVSKPVRGLNTLIGRERARDLIVNIVLPALYLFGLESDDGTLANCVRELYCRYPKLAENEITRAMRRQLFGPKGKGERTLNVALAQQGLIHLHKMFCTPLSCQACLALPENR